MKNLYSVSKNKVFRIVSVPDIALLKNLGVYTNREVVVQNRYAFGGPVLLRVQDTYSVALGKDIAKKIEVQEVTI